MICQKAQSLWRMLITGNTSWGSQTQLWRLYEVINGFESRIDTYIAAYAARIDFDRWAMSSSKEPVSYQ